MVEELKRCQIILDEFFDDINTGNFTFHDNSQYVNTYIEPFHEPVTWRELGLFDYPKLIKTPMDMGTVRSKMGKYKTHEGFIADMRLIWSNCMIYNADGSDFHALAENLMEKLNEALKDANLVSKDMENRYLYYLLYINIGMCIYLKKYSSYSEPTLEEKAEFSENIYKLPSDVLGQIVNILDEKCPGALDKVRHILIRVEV